MLSLTSLDAVEALYDTAGALHYGEGVSQLEHALQCADLARAQGEAPSLIIAALLHDIGHLVEDEAEVASFEVDDRHEATGVRLLSSLFGPEVLQPIALHVAAKRYLCWADPKYLTSLSPASQASLKLQGGPYSREQAEHFERLPYFRQAVTLRTFDDMGKRDETSTVVFGDFLPMMQALLIGA